MSWPLRESLVEAERRHFQELSNRPRMAIWSPISGGSSRRLTPMRQNCCACARAFSSANRLLCTSRKRSVHRSMRTWRGWRSGEASLSWETEIQPRDVAAFHAALTVSAVRDPSATDRQPRGDPALAYTRRDQALDRGTADRDPTDAHQCPAGHQSCHHVEVWICKRSWPYSSID